MPPRNTKKVVIPSKTKSEQIDFWAEIPDFANIDPRNSDNDHNLEEIVQSMIDSLDENQEQKTLKQQRKPRGRVGAFKADKL